jgi:hypothetical protein
MILMKWYLLNYQTSSFLYCFNKIFGFFNTFIQMCKYIPL